MAEDEGYVLMPASWVKPISMLLGKFCLESGIPSVSRSGKVYLCTGCPLDLPGVCIKEVLATLKPLTVGEGERDPVRDLATCEAATPGPWRARRDNRIYCPAGYYVATVYELLTPDGASFDAATTNANLQVMAESRTALPYWIGECLMLRKKLQAIEEATTDG